MKLKLGRTELILLAILLIGLFLRLYDLGGESVWFDEVFSINLAHSSLLGVIEGSAQDYHPPLYHILLHSWISLFGDSEVSARLMSVLFGVFAIFLMYKLGTLIFDERVGIFASLLLALSSFHIYYSQEARMYSLTAFLTLLSMYFFLRLLKHLNVVNAVGYVLSSVLMIYTLYFSVFILIAQNIYVFTLFLSRKNDLKPSLRRWILLQLTLALLFSPWLAVFIKQLLLTQSGLGIGWIPVPTIHSIIGTFNQYAGSNLLLPLFLLLSCFAVLPYKKLYGRTYWNDWFRSLESYEEKIGLSHNERNYLLLVWLFTPIIIAFVISKVSAPIYWDRQTIVALPAFYLLVAIGIRNIRHRHLKLAIIGIAIIGSLLGVWQTYSTVNKHQWREVAAKIDQDAKEGDLLLFNADFNRFSFEYYSKRGDLIKRPFPGTTNAVDEDNIRELGSTVKGHNRVWVVLAHSGDFNGLIKKTLGEFYNPSYSKEYVSITPEKYPHTLEVYLFEKDAAAISASRCCDELHPDTEEENDQ